MLNICFKVIFLQTSYVFNFIATNNLEFIGYVFQSFIFLSMMSLTVTAFTLIYVARMKTASISVRKMCLIMDTVLSHCICMYKMLLCVPAFH
jgi:hypothetical protein